MSKRKSIFQKRTSNKVTLSVKIKAETKQRIDSIHNELEKISPELTFNTTKIIERTLEEALTSAEKELSTLIKESANDEHQHHDQAS